jgi:hypothetical protein
MNSLYALAVEVSIDTASVLSVGDAALAANAHPSSLVAARLAVGR